MLIRGIDGCSASRDSVAEVLKQGGSPAVSPGGISEMFQGYPKKGFSPNQEVALLRNRKGFIKLSHIHNVPTIPVYVFGSSKLMRRLDVPGLEVLSRVLRASLCVIYGRLGLPVPFRIGLTYVVGKAIYPRGTVEETHERFCEELKRIFDEFKGDYGWDRKELVIV
ncbi:hypothetical protein TrVE_jg12606 [Triparma verrucosa]|uniref:Acyltransferase n=1 Tax=Triparma verrucosa TaxID=1606542 RepID=A0A9W7EXI0_9STRA|nr:hypothetical protein TrVE_jg12606 [Triparma verrucosa]